MAEKQIFLHKLSYQSFTSFTNYIIMISLRFSDTAKY